MRGLLKTFDHTKMIVLVSVTAGLYASLLIPFKVLVIVPGYTEIRPGSVIPFVCSLFFGPAAAWGAAFGNLLGDFFGMLGIGSLFGMFGNFLYGYIPYRVWMQGGGAGVVKLDTAADVARFVLAATASSIACGVSIAWGLDLLGFVPFVLLANVITINNILVTLVLGPLLLKLLSGRLNAWGLNYRRIMGDAVRPSPRIQHAAGLILVYAGGLLALAYANIKQFTGSTALDYSISTTLLNHTVTVHTGTTPGFLMILLGCVLI